MAWHHWRKVRRLPSEPPGELRAAASPGRAGCAGARCPRLHRDKAVDEESRATLDALAGCRWPSARCCCWLLTTLSAEEIAREARHHPGARRAGAEDRHLELHAATAACCPATCAPLRAARGHRRGHALAAADDRHAGAGLRPAAYPHAGRRRRRGRRVRGLGLRRHGASGDRPLPRLAVPATRPRRQPAGDSRTPYPLAATTLLAPSQIAARPRPQLDRAADLRRPRGGGWRCRASATVRRPARRGGAGAHVRGRRAVARRGQAPARPAPAARPGCATVRVRGGLGDGRRERAYRPPALVRRCSDAAIQLLATHRVAGVGDDAVVLLAAQLGAGSPHASAVGVARSGQATVTTLVRSSRRRRRTRVTAGTAGLLAASVNGLCGSPAPAPAPARRGSGAPSRLPGRAARRHAQPSRPAAGRPGRSRAVGGHGPREGATTNVAATRCDNTSFDGRASSTDMTRTFLFPANREARRTFGLTQTVGHA